VRCGASRVDPYRHSCYLELKNEEKLAVPPCVVWREHEQGEAPTVCFLGIGPMQDRSTSFGFGEGHVQGRIWQDVLQILFGEEHLARICFSDLCYRSLPSEVPMT